MKILIICSNEFPAPPPTDSIHAPLLLTTQIAEEMKKRGHLVTMVCAKGSTVNVRQVNPESRPFFQVISKTEWDNVSSPYLRVQLIFPYENDLHLAMLDELRKEKYDLVDFHSARIYYGLPFSSRTNLPNIFTLHDSFSQEEAKVIESFNVGENYFVSLSNKQREPFKKIKFIKTIPHGIPLNEFGFCKDGGERMVFAGRLKKVKGAAESIIVSQKTNKPLYLSGQFRGSETQYFNETITPLLTRNKKLVTYLQFINHDTIDTFYGKGRLLLFPILWEEPFGLVMIESMATGTPVVAFARGSVPEIVKDGETGFIVNSSPDDIRGNWIIKKTGIEGLCEAVEKIYAMPEAEYRQMRRACRAHVEKNFTVEKMVDQYEEVYEKILSGK